MRTRKEILQRKNAEKMLELLKSGKTVLKAAKEIGIWYNVAKYLEVELRKAGLLETNITLENMLKSPRSQIIVDMFKESSTISQKDIINNLGLSRLPGDVLEDLKSLQDSNLITVSTVRKSKYFTLNK